MRFGNDEAAMKSFKHNLFGVPPSRVSNRLKVELQLFLLKPLPRWPRFFSARAHGMWTYEPRQGRKAATVVCSASAVVTLASFLLWNCLPGIRKWTRKRLAYSFVIRHSSFGFNRMSYQVIARKYRRSPTPSSRTASLTLICSAARAAPAKPPSRASLPNASTAPAGRR